MAEPLRHRQTKEAATDMFYLKPPRHISTLPKGEVPDRAGHVCFTPDSGSEAYPHYEVLSDATVPVCTLRAMPVCGEGRLEFYGVALTRLNVAARDLASDDQRFFARLLDIHKRPCAERPEGRRTLTLDAATLEEKPCRAVHADSS